jgi:hypothetical protein
MLPKKYYLKGKKIVINSNRIEIKIPNEYKIPDQRLSQVINKYTKG